jgi:predicted lipoprotein
MHQKKSQVVGWKMFNFVHSAKEFFLEAILKDGMIGWAKIQPFKFGPMQDLNRVQ